MNTTNTRIKTLRKALDLTQQVFADRLGMKQNSIALIESGRKTSEQTIKAICREFHVNETWLRTGEGEMFLPPPRDALDELIAEYKLPREFRTVIEKYLALTPDQQAAVMEYVRSIAVDIAAMDFPAQPAPRVPPGYSSRAELEAEADEFAAMAREQFLSEKIPGYQAFSANGSDGGGKLA